MAKPKEVSSLDSIIKAVNKELGAGVMLKGSDARMDIQRISTGITSFDVMLGGGWPCNQWSEIIGDESSGKTALAYKTIAENQARDPEWTAVWIAAEEFVPDYAKAIGVDLDRLFLVETNLMEPVYNLLLDLQENRACDCIVLDSMPALVPTIEDEKDMEEATVGKGALLNGRFFRKTGIAGRRSLVEEDRPWTGLIINQWREKIGVMYGDPRTTPGGKAKNFAYFTRVEVKRDEWIKDRDEVVGQSIKARTIKNKSYRPNRTAVVDFYFTDINGFHLGSFDVVKDMVNLGIAFDIIERAGAYYRFNGEQWRGKEELLVGVRESIDIQELLREQVLARV